MKLRITIDGKAYIADVEILEDGESAPEYPPYPTGPSTFVAADPPEPAIAEKDVAGNDKECRSPVTGMVIRILVETGQVVQANDVVMVLESMKMEMQITAMHEGTVKSVPVTVGASVKVNQLLVEFE